MAAVAPVPVPAVPVLVHALAAAGNFSMTGPDPDGLPDLSESEHHRNKLLEFPALPRRELLDFQSSWLAPARSRILRRIAIARKHRILDLGAGYGQVTVELARRSSGLVVAYDLNELSLRETDELRRIVRVAGDAALLPFGSGSFDLIYSQFSLLWIKSLPQTLDEITRVLEPTGVLVALEPDYAAMIEYPPAVATRQIWLDALLRSGADPRIGRKLPGQLAALGFSVRVNLLEQIQPPSPQRFEFLEGLPLTDVERSRLRDIRKLAVEHVTGDGQQISHLPVFLITAVKRTSKS